MSHLTPQEAAIMRMWDARKSMSEIAAKLFLNVETVKRTVNMYDGQRDFALHCRDMKQGSRSLQDAIERAKAGLPPLHGDANSIRIPGSLAEQNSRFVAAIERARAQA